MHHSGDHDWSQDTLCTVVVDGKRCYERKPSPRDFMVEDKWDRRNLTGVRWLLFTPGMQDELRTATDEQLVDYASGVDGDWFSKKVHEAQLGDWVPFKDGIAVRIGNCIEES